jgi:outer membrane protein assembly factor BamB
MARIRLNVVRSQLNAANPGGPLAAFVASALTPANGEPARVTRQNLQKAVDDYRAGGQSPTEAEGTALRRIYSLMQDDFFKSEAPAALTTACEVASIQSSPTSSAPAGSSPHFTSIAAPRFPSGGPATGNEVVWSHFPLKGGVSAPEYGGLPVFSPDHQHLYALPRDGKLRSFARDTGKLEWELQLNPANSGFHTTPAVTPDGKHLLVADTVRAANGSNNDQVRLFCVDVEAQQVKWALGPQFPSPGNYYSNSRACSPTLSPDGKTVYLADRDEAEVSAYSVETGKKQWTVMVPQASGSVLPSSDGLKVYVASPFAVQAFDLVGNQLWETQADDAELAQGALSGDGQTLIYPGSDTVRAIDGVTGKELWKTPLFDSDNGTFRVAFSPDDSKVAVSGKGTLRVYEARTGLPLWAGDHPSGLDFEPQCAPAFSADGQKLYAIDRHRMVVEVDLENESRRQIQHRRNVVSPAFVGRTSGFALSPDGRWAYQTTTRGELISMELK